MTERVLLALVGMYSLALTLRHFWLPPQTVVNLCDRDFVQPAATGSCLCRERQYCMCTPSLASDVILELEDPGSGVRGVAFVVRGDGRGLAMIGGFVKVGESAEEAALRETLEETGLRASSLRQWCMFSAAARDPRGHTAAQVFIARAAGVPRAADDAKAIRVVPIDQLQQHLPRFAFDHAAIVAAYMEQHHPPAGRAHPRAPAASDGYATSTAAACLRSQQGSPLPLPASA